MPAPDALSGPSKLPRAGKPTSIVVMLHGYGADGNDLIGLAPYFAQSLPKTAFYSPHAPTPLEGGWGGGRQWASLRNYDPVLLKRDPQARAEKLATALEGTDETLAAVNKFLDQVMEFHELPANKLALLGFSQGTMVSIYVGLRRKQQLGGIVGYSGAVLAPDKLNAEIVTRPPVLLVHGDADPVVPIEMLYDGERALKAANVPYEAHVVPELQHGIDGTGAALAAKFLKDKLA